MNYASHLGFGFVVICLIVVLLSYRNAMKGGW